MMREKSRRPSPLQRRVLIVLAALGAKRPGPVATRDIERVLEQGGDAPVYGPNLRASCRRMEAAGWLRTLRAPNLQLAVELTDAGRALAAPLLADEQARVLAEQRATAVRVLPLVPHSQAEEAEDRPVTLDDRWHLACRGDYVIRLDGTTCIQLWSAAGQVTRLEGDPLQVAAWLQACHDAGIAVRVQINESAAPEEGSPDGTAPADLTGTWYCQLDTALLALGITGLTEDIRLAVVSPEASLRMLPAPARLLHVLRDADPLTAATYEEDTEAALADLLARAGFTGDQAQELQWHRIRWPQMSQEEADRRELNSLLDELEQEFQLIERRRQGLGKPNLLYVKDLYAGLSQSNYWKYENHTSGGLKNELPGVPKSNGSNTEKINKTDNSETDPIYPAELQEEEQYRRYFKEALELEILEQGYPADKAVLYEILELLVETVTSRKKFLRICGEEKPREVVKSRLMKLDSSHIQYILECLKENSTQIRNIKQYLLATLYNAPVTVDSYYSAQVRHEFGWGGRVDKN